MRKNSKFLSLVSLLLIFVLAVSIFSGCNKKAADDTSSAAPEQESSTEVSEAPKGPLDHIEKQDLGLLLNVLVEGDWMNTYKSVEIVPNETNPEVLNSAITERNNMVEERIGVKFNEIRAEGAGEMSRLLRDNNLSGTKLYDIAMPYFHDAALLAPEGIFYNLMDFKNIINFDKDYWDPRCVNDTMIGDKLYFTTGDSSLLTLDCTHCLIFNTDVIKKYGIKDNPYDLVLNGKWTIDKMMEMAKVATHDSDGESGMSYLDNWGFFVNENYATSMFIGAGERLSSKDENNLPVITVNSANASNVVGKIVDVFNDKSATIKIESFAPEAGAAGSSCWAETDKAVAEGRALFRAMSLRNVLNLEKYDFTAYGILPTPKLNEEQEKYHSYVSTIYSSCFTIPVECAAEPEKIALALEALNAATPGTVRQAYYDNILKKRSMQDDESEKMLDIIFETRVYELGAIYSWGQTQGIFDPNSLTNFINKIAQSGENTFASKWESIEEKVNEGVKRTIELYTK